MSRQVQTARGVTIDFDELLIKQQLANAPMNIEVARRKNFIENKEVSAKQQIPDNQIIDISKFQPIEKITVKSENFENENEDDELPSITAKTKK